MKIKTILLDSSNLAQIVRDISSRQPDRIRRAKEFESKLIENGYCIFLTSHQILELLRHNDFEVRLLRINYLRSLKIVSWIRNINSYGVGSIIDLHAAEVFSITNANSSSIDDVRLRVKARSICFGTGVDACKLFSETWQDLHSTNLAIGEREREVIAISRSKFADIGKTKLSSWLAGKIRDNTSTESNFRALQEKLKDDIVLKGDKRISDKQQVAKEFIDLVRGVKGEWNPSAGNPALNYLFSLGIKPSDIVDDITMDEIGELASFRAKMEIVSKNLPDIDPEDIRKIDPRSMPSYLVDRAIRYCMQDQSEWKGSDLNDRYLASFAPFVDITCMDKRTYQSLVDGSRKFADLKRMNLNFQKIASYEKVLL